MTELHVVQSCMCMRWPVVRINNRIKYFSIIVLWRAADTLRAFFVFNLCLHCFKMEKFATQ